MGFDNFTLITILRMARQNGVALTDRHYEILQFAYDYYKANKVGPLYYTFKKNCQLSKEELRKLFPHSLASVYTWLGIPIHTVEKGCKPPAVLEVENKREVYLDHNATTYIRPEVMKVLTSYYSGSLGFGNPSSASSPGKTAYEQISAARKTIASILEADPEEIIFTGSGSEANNMIIKGMGLKHRTAKGRIITSTFEHPSVRKTLEFLEDDGFEIIRLPVGPEGIVSPENLQRAITKNTILVCVMTANNEIGTIQPIEEIGHICSTKGIPFFTDAIQAFGKINLEPEAMGISALSMSSHKIYGPKGIGALYISRDLQIPQLIHGGDQEYGLRAGTENVGHIIAFAEAAKLISKDRADEQARLLDLRNYFLDGVTKIEPSVKVMGSLSSRLANNITLGFPHCDSSALLLSFDNIGVYASAGSACSAGKIETAQSIKAIGADTGEYGVIRFGFGLRTNKDDLDYFFTYLPEILSQIQEDQF